jgi:redox-sensitive bicupin YhaK (pirin superfamily)
MSKTVVRLLSAVATFEGEGVAIHRAFPSPSLNWLDPFLLLDEMGPYELEPGDANGFPTHPHRGFETVTYLLSGEMEHRDSAGGHGVLGPGDVQWMTAGAGLVHSEMPGCRLMREGGVLHGFQLWVNLPRASKMTPPKYQELPAHEIPSTCSAGGAVTVKVIAGEALGVSAKIRTHTPMCYLHFTLAPGAEHVQSLPQGFNTFVYIVDGTVAVGERESKAEPQTLAIFSREGEAIRLANPGDIPANLLLVGGEPIGEPVARHGPFVMNTHDELVRAFEDFRSGRMGSL